MTDEDKRRAALQRFEDAMWHAMAEMPAGYPGACADRDKFVAPLENLIDEVRRELGK